KTLIKWTFFLGSLLSIIFTTLIIAVSFYIVIFKRLQQLVKISQIMSQGKLAEALTFQLTSSRDELGKLSFTFKQMLNKLFESQVSLEQKVEQLHNESI